MLNLFLFVSFFLAYTDDFLSELLGNIALFNQGIDFLWFDDSTTSSISHDADGAASNNRCESAPAFRFVLFEGYKDVLRRLSPHRGSLGDTMRM